MNKYSKMCEEQLDEMYDACVGLKGKHNVEVVNAVKAEWKRRSELATAVKNGLVKYPLHPSLKK